LTSFLERLDRSPIECIGHGFLKSEAIALHRKIFAPLSAIDAATLSFIDATEDEDGPRPVNFEKTKSAIQAAVNVLVPDIDTDDDEPLQDWQWHEAGHWLDGYDACRADILENAEITDE
jgi:hypothetical protein